MNQYGEDYERLENQNNGVVNAEPPASPRACGCQRWKCLTVSFVIVLSMTGCVFGYLLSKGAFKPVKHSLPSCELKINGTDYCKEVNTGLEFPIFLHPLPFESKSVQPFPGGKGGVCEENNRDYRCHTLTGLNLITADVLNQLMVVGLYVDPYSAKTKLQKYKNKPPKHVYSKELKKDMLSGGIPMTVEWEFVLSNWHPCPLSLLEDHFTGNLKPYLKASGKLTDDEIKAALNYYVKSCFPVDSIDAKDKVRFTWNLAEKTASCQFNKKPYASFSVKGADILAKAIFEFTLDYNGNAVVNLLPSLWSWGQNDN